MLLLKLILDNVLFTMALASTSHSTPSELVFVAQPLNVYDTVFGEFLP